MVPRYDIPAGRTIVAAVRSYSRVYNINYTPLKGLDRIIYPWDTFQDLWVGLLLITFYYDRMTSQRNVSQNPCYFFFCGSLIFFFFEFVEELWILNSWYEIVYFLAPPLILMNINEFLNPFGGPKIPPRRHHSFHIEIYHPKQTYR